MVVGTVRDPADVWPRLEATFRFAMCVVKVEFNQIDAVAAEIGQVHPDWITKVTLEQNRVRVIIPVPDGDTLRQLDRYPAALPPPSKNSAGIC